MHVKGRDGCSAHEIMRGSTVTVRFMHCTACKCKCMHVQHSSHHVEQDLVWHAIEVLHVGRCGDCMWSTEPSGLRKNAWSLLGFVAMCSNAEQVLLLDAYHRQEHAEIVGCYEDSMEATA